MLRKNRILLAFVFFIAITMLFLDFTGTTHQWFGWMPKIQFLPAVLSLNVIIIALLVVLTLLLGRVYCSVICPMGVFQDVIAWISRKFKKKNPYSYSKPKNWLRYPVLVLFIIALVAGVGSLVALLAPYSSYGRIASNLLQPIYVFANNLIASVAEKQEVFDFYQVDIWVRAMPVLIIAAVTFVIVFILAWIGGRTYCNTICPVGTVLGFLARFSWLKPVIDEDKCNKCGLCSRNCKAAAINSKEQKIDYSRCVTCMNCIGKCKQHAISYCHPTSKKAETPAGPVDESRRAMLVSTGILAATAVVKAQEKTVDGGLAVIEDKQIPERQTPLTPAGSLSAKNLASHCTGCQLCVAACPNGVLRPSTGLMDMMQPTMSYERGYCRPECTRCSDVCPAGAIRPITREGKSSTQIGHAVWIKKNCVVFTDNVSCGNCARHCPSGAIQMVPSDPNDEASPKIPAIDVERCIGCGACENLCPSRPFSAIYVEGHEVHKTI